MKSRLRKTQHIWSSTTRYYRYIAVGLLLLPPPSLMYSDYFIYHQSERYFSACGCKHTVITSNWLKHRIQRCQQMTRRASVHFAHSTTFVSSRLLYVHIYEKLNRGAQQKIIYYFNGRLRANERAHVHTKTKQNLDARATATLTKKPNQSINRRCSQQSRVS